MTRMKNDGIVCVRAREQKKDEGVRSSLHHFMMDKFPPLLSSRVGCHSDDEWLPSAFLAGGGMWQFIRADTSMCLTALPPYRFSSICSITTPPLSHPLWFKW